MESNKDLFILENWKVLRFSGPDRGKTLQGVLTCDVPALGEGSGGWACLLTPKGVLRAILFLYNAGDSFLAICPETDAARMQADLKNVLMLGETKLEETILAPVCAKNFESLSFLPAEQAAQAGTVSREDVMGWRIEKGLALIDADLDEKAFPQEAGFERAVSYSKGCYLGQETMSRLHHMGHVNRALVRLKLSGPAERGAELRSAGGEIVGRLGSVGYSKGLSCVVGLALVKLSEAKVGSKLSAGAIQAEVI